MDSSAIRRQETQVELSGAGLRYRRSWLPRDPRHAMVLVHGYAEHSGRYDEMAMHFAARGFAVHAYDQAGHGRTRGPRGHVDRFKRLVDELVRFVDLVRQEDPSLPLTLVGHSMGGLVTAASAVLGKPAADRIVLSGALLQVGDAGGPDWRLQIKARAARLLAPLGPLASFSMGLDARGLSRDPEVVRRYEEDPLVKDRISARFASGMLAMVETVRRSPERVEIPMLLLHGEADPICPVAGSRAFHAGLSPAIAARSALKIHPGLRHEIFQEPEREAVWQDMLDWLGE
jgi:alpha-beta hydrolase superfamily lysophospholipase